MLNKQIYLGREVTWIFPSQLLYIHGGAQPLKRDKSADPLTAFTKNGSRTTAKVYAPLHLHYLVLRSYGNNGEGKPV